MKRSSVQKKEKDKEDYLRYLSLISVPFLLVVAPLLGYFFGHYLDTFFDTKPYLSYLFLFLGIVAAIREFYKLIKKFQNDDQSNH